MWHGLHGVCVWGPSPVGKPGGLVRQPGLHQSAEQPEGTGGAGPFKVADHRSRSDHSTGVET
eukprot:5756588-Prorocentrum_lima.AAC.1